MIGIYKITNQINGKIYIGQSIDIELRWKAHQTRFNNPNSHEYDYHLYRSMRKYGLDNFSFELVELCEKDELNDRERYWIKYYDSYNNGYNETEGGNSVHPLKISTEQLYEIDIMLKNMVDIGEIADHFGVSYEMIQGINTGRHRYREYIDYPIGKYMQQIKEDSKKRKEHYCIDCGAPIGLNAVRCTTCSQINRRKVVRPDVNYLLKLLTVMPVVQIGKLYGVSDKAIVKWCIAYNIPHNKKDVIKYIQQHNIDVQLK